MPTYQELRSTYARWTTQELQELALRPLELTAQGQAALADELSLRDAPTEPETQASLTSASTRVVSRHGWWLTLFQAWVTLQMVVFTAVFIVLHPVFDS